MFRTRVADPGLLKVEVETTAADETVHELKCAR